MESVVYTKTSKIQNCDYRISNLEFHNYPVVFQVEHNENSDEIYCVALYKEVFLMNLKLKILSSRHKEQMIFIMN